MPLLKQQEPSPAKPEELGKMLENYLMLLAQTRPFNLEISAPSSQVYEELVANWPPIDGWNEQVRKLLGRIRDLSQYLSETGHERHLRLSVTVSKLPPLPQLDPHEPALLMALDVMEGTMLHQRLDVDPLEHDPLFNNVELGLTLVVQPFDSDGDARAIGFGMISANPEPKLETARKR